MELEIIKSGLTVCKVGGFESVDLTADLFFLGKTDEEISLVCKTEDAPSNTVEREDGWRAFRIKGKLDFSLVGVLSKLSGALAENNISVFAVSTFDTDYILVKDKDFEKAIKVLAFKGYTAV